MRERLGGRDVIQVWEGRGEGLMRNLGIRSELHSLKETVGGGGTKM